jgi:hypothetical protein
MCGADGDKVGVVRVLLALVTIMFVAPPHAVAALAQVQSIELMCCQKTHTISQKCMP